MDAGEGREQDAVALAAKNFKVRQYPKNKPPNTRPISVKIARLIHSFTICKETLLRLLGFYWGIAGVIAFLLFAVFRLSPRIWELGDYSLSPLQWAVLVGFSLWMAWAEGYKGFHRAFSPRVVARANYLRESNQRQTSHPVLSLFAPVYCMGFIHATRKRKIVSYTITGMIFVLVLLLRITPQPWRGIIDAGVVTGLGLGILSLLYFWLQVETGKWRHDIPLDLPGTITPAGGPEESGVRQAGQP